MIHIRCWLSSAELFLQRKKTQTETLIQVNLKKCYYEVIETSCDIMDCFLSVPSYSKYVPHYNLGKKICLQLLFPPLLMTFTFFFLIYGFFLIILPIQSLLSYKWTTTLLPPEHQLCFTGSYCCKSKAEQLKTRSADKTLLCWSSRPPSAFLSWTHFLLIYCITEQFYPILGELILFSFIISKQLIFFLAIISTRLQILQSCRWLLTEVRNGYNG